MATQIITPTAKSISGRSPLLSFLYHFTEVKMSDLKLEHRSVIKFLTKEGGSLKKIHERMVAVQRKSSPLYFQVKYRCKHFK